MIGPIVFSMIAAVSCPETKLIGFDAPLTKQETESLNTAKKRCGEIYREEGPCLKSFEKMEDQVFRAICGRP